MACKIMTISEKLCKCGSTLNKNLRVMPILIRQQSKYFFDLANVTNRKEFTEKKLVGFSMEQMFEVVSDVENYHKFVPWCKKSFVHSKQQDFLKADLVIGFPPLNEMYTSNVSMIKPSLVKAECVNGRLFNYLLTLWKFSPGVKDIPQSCVIDFKVSFEFKSLLHTQLSLLFFDQLVKQMEGAFITEAKNRYGKPSIKSHVLVARKT